MSQMVNIPSTNTDPSYRYEMPRLISKREGRGNGVKTSILNVKEVATAIHRPPEYVMKWYGCELGSKSSYSEKESEGARAIIMGHHDTAELQNLLDKFLHVYVLCPTCGLPEIGLRPKKTGDICGKCTACGFEDRLEAATVHKMA